MSQREKKAASRDGGEVERVSSEDLAALIIDALLRAEIVTNSDVKRAIAIATEEIEVRKALGDYS